MHVPEAGDEVLTGCVDNLSRCGLELRGGSDGGDAVAIDDDRAVGLSFSGDGVDYGGVGDGEGLRVGAEGQKRKGKEEIPEGPHKLMVMRC